MRQSMEQMSKSPRIIAITSGKGGVGKTSITVNTGIALCQKGYKVCLFDADSNLANINILLGISPEYTLQHVLNGDKTIQQIMLQKAGLYVVPGASGIADFVGLAPAAQHRLIHALEELEKDFDYLLVDTSSGIDTTVLSFVEAANQSIVVITPEPTSLTDAFSLLRVLRKRNHQKKVNIVVNSVTTEQRAQKIFGRFADAVEKYLGYRPNFLGSVLKDDLLSSAVCMQNPVIQYRPTAPSSNGFYRLADSIDKHIDASTTQTLSSQWKQQAVESPDFSDTAAAEQATSRVLSLDDHQQAILNYLQNPEMTEEQMSSMMTTLTDAYVARFHEYPVSPKSMLDQMIHTDHASDKQLHELLEILQSAYENNFGIVEKASTTRFLCSLVNRYVENYQEYPFDAISTLYQSFDLTPPPENKLRELLTNLHLMYRDQYRPDDVDASAENNTVQCCPADDSEEFEKLTAIIQQRNLRNLEQKLYQEFGVKSEATQIEEISKQPVLHEVVVNESVPEKADKASDDYDELLDSIRYASLTD